MNLNKLLEEIERVMSKYTHSKKKIKRKIKITNLFKK